MAYELQESIGYLVRSVTRALRSHFDRRLREEGVAVTSDQWAILVSLRQQDGQCQRRLGYITMLEKTAVSRLIDDMEQKELVLRVPDQLDKRQKLVYLTRRGRMQYQAMLPLVEETLCEAERGIPARRMQECKEVLRLVFANLHG